MVKLLVLKVNTRMWILGLLGVLLLLLLAGCVSSQYLATVEFVNPHTGQTQRVNVPMSQYKYDQVKVGQEYSVTVHTFLFGVQTPITEMTSSGGIGIGDTLPIVLLGATGWVLVTAVWGLLKQRTRSSWGLMVIALVAVMFAVVAVSTAKPEFTTVGTIVDKTFSIGG